MVDVTQEYGCDELTTGDVLCGGYNDTFKYNI